MMNEEAKAMVAMARQMARANELMALSVVLKNHPSCDRGCGRLSTYQATSMDGMSFPMCPEHAEQALGSGWSGVEPLLASRLVYRLTALLKDEG